MSTLVKVLRPYKYGTFLSCVIGATVGGVPIDNVGGFLIRLLLFFASFAGLSYAGLYLLNDLTDLRWDRRHPQKRERLIASGTLSAYAAAAISLLLLALGTALGTVIDHRLPIIIAAFAVVNISYSLVFKHIPYLDLLVNTLTHPLRVIAGIVLFGALSMEHLPVILASGAFYFGTNALKRHAELKQEGIAFRPVLRHYTPRFLAVCSWFSAPILGALAIFAPSSLQLGLICIALALYASIIWGYWFGKPPIRKKIAFFLRQ